MYQQKDNARSMGSKRLVELVHVKRLSSLSAFNTCQQYMICRYGKVLGHMKIWYNSKSIGSFINFSRMKFFGPEMYGYLHTKFE